MQATVSAFDPTDGSGVVLLDSGHELAFDSSAFARSGLRLLRPGQRVRLLTSTGSPVDGAASSVGPVRIDALTISTLAFRDDDSAELHP